MKKWMVLELALVCVFLFAGCTQEPAPGNSESAVPGETPGVIIKSITEEPREGERSVDPGFSAQVPDGAGTGDADIGAQAPEGNPDPDFDVSVEPENGEGGTVVITPEPEE